MGIAKKKITLSEERYFELLNKESKLTALENAGVDNWSGYSEAMEDHDEYDKYKKEA
ncbi:hypothetical protein ACTOJ1_000926 [Shigella flexneri]